MSAVYSGGLLYDAVKTEGGKRWIFMIKEFSGDVTVYRKIKRRNSINGDNYDSEKFYFRQKAQQRGIVVDLTKNNVKKGAFYSCKPVMDSLIEKMDWSTYLTDMLTYYNERCLTIKGAK